MSQERVIAPFKARIAAGITLTTGAFLASCGGGEKQETTQSPTSNPETPIPTLRVTPESTLAPTPELIPLLSPQELVDVVGGAVSSLPGGAYSVEVIMAAPSGDSAESMKKRAGASGIAQSAGASIEFINAIDNLSNLKGLLNNSPEAAEMIMYGYGDLGGSIVNLACANPDNQKLAEAWITVREQAESYGRHQEISGNLPKDGSTGYIEFSFQMPAGCQNPLIVEYDRLNPLPKIPY